MTKYQKQVAKIGRLFRIGKIEEEEYYNLREKFEQLEAKKMSVKKQLIAISEERLERLIDHLKHNSITQAKLTTERVNLMADKDEVQKKLKTLKEV
jgi:hypothetical protein